MGNAELPAYGAMKRAVNSLTESAAVTYGPEGIRVNALCPCSQPLVDGRYEDCRFVVLRVELRRTAAAAHLATILSRASRVRLGVQDHP
ncbi:hypothetical protein GCM10010317_050450 [Streptomyces mirabilis]|nr:hypothetical protein GCM10010317_050450 [Streptomyces mirabilis]